MSKALESVISVLGGNPALNYSPYAAPGMFLSTMLPHWYGLYLTRMKFENRHPRAYMANIQNKPKKEPWEKTYLRAEAAQMNGWESMGLFLASLAAANAAKLPASTLNGYSAAYLLSRLIYNYIYIAYDTEQMAPVRSLVWLAGAVMNIRLFMKAANSF